MCPGLCSNVPGCHKICSETFDTKIISAGIFQTPKVINVLGLQFWSSGSVYDDDAKLFVALKLPTTPEWHMVIPCHWGHLQSHLSHLVLPCHTGSHLVSYRPAYLVTKVSKLSNKGIRCHKWSYLVTRFPPLSHIVMLTSSHTVIPCHKDSSFVT